jgi:hypothetical protein
MGRNWRRAQPQGPAPRQFLTRQIQEISDTESRAVRALSIDPEVFDLALAPPSRRAGAAPPAIGPVHAQLLDLPTLRSEQPPVLSRIAVFADPWPGT